MVVMVVKANKHNIESQVHSHRCTVSLSHTLALSV